jgi:hypothetical protein
VNVHFELEIRTATLGDPQNPLKLPNGESRKWLEDGDMLTITGWCEGGDHRVGFGEVRGRIIAAPKRQ